MTNISYHTVISNSLVPEIIRQAMVERYYSINRNASAVAREYGTKRQTVSKWVHRFEQDGIIGLKDCPRIPHTEPIHKKPKDIEKEYDYYTRKKEKIPHWTRPYPVGTAPGNALLYGHY